MKFDLQKKTNRFTLRALEAFSSQMFSLLQEQSFESITVLKICELTQYPRATFYNYFTDKYDLLEYCWTLIHQQIDLDSPLSLSGKGAYEVFGRLYDYFQEKREGFVAVMSHNKPDGELFASFHRHLQQQILNSLLCDPDTDDSIIPLDLLANHTSQTVMLVLDYCLMKEPLVSKAQAELYLKYLLKKRGT